MKFFKTILLCSFALVLFGCENNNREQEPEQPVNEKHGNIGDAFTVNGLCYMITSNYAPYEVELEPGTSSYSGNIVIPSAVEYDGVKFAVTSIGVAAFYNSSVKSVIIPNSVLEIKLNAFRMCYSMESLDLGHGVKKIDSYAFATCKNLTELTIPGSVEQMGDCAFEECYHLQKLHIEEGVKQIGWQAFTRRVYPTAKSYVYCYCITPPEIVEKGGSCAAFTITNAALYVPSSVVSTYRKTPGWKNFSSIYGM